jgi:phosphatidylserine synthase
MGVLGFFMGFVAIIVISMENQFKSHNQWGIMAVIWDFNGFSMGLHEI